VHGLVLHQPGHIRVQVDVFGAAVLLAFAAEAVEQDHVHDVGPLVARDEQRPGAEPVLDQVAVHRVRLAQPDEHPQPPGQRGDPLVERAVEQVELVGHQHFVGTAVGPLPLGPFQREGDDLLGDLPAELHGPGHHAGGVLVLAGVEALGLVAHQQQRRGPVGQHVDLHRPQPLPHQVQRLGVDRRAEHRPHAAARESAAELLVVLGVLVRAAADLLDAE
jgi:hypothetical protein